jgi:hypothetical protein
VILSQNYLGPKKIVLTGFSKSIPNNGADFSIQLQNSPADKYIIAGLPIKSTDKGIATVSVVTVKFKENSTFTIKQQVNELLF